MEVNELVTIPKHNIHKLIRFVRHKKYLKPCKYTVVHCNNIELASGLRFFT